MRLRKNFNEYLDYILDNFKSSMNAHKFPHCSNIAELMDLINSYISDLQNTEQRIEDKLLKLGIEDNIMYTT